MAQNGLITINSKRIFDVDVDPSVSGFSAPIGSLAMSDAGELFIKVGAGDTDWDLVQSGAPTADWTIGGNTIGADSKLGSLDAFDVFFVRNDVEVMRLDNDGANKLLMSARIDMSTNQIKNLGDGTLTFDAINLGQLNTGLATKLSLDGSLAMTGALNMGSQQINFMQDPSIASDGATKGYVDSQIALVATGASFREFCKVFTADLAPANDTALSTLLPFSDDELPQLVIGDFSDGDYIMFEADSVSPKLRRIYDDAGTLKVTSVGVTQPAKGYLYNVRYNLLDSPSNQENAAGYILPDAGLALIKVYDYDWNNSEGIAVGGTFTPASGTINASDSVHVALEKLQGNINDLSADVADKWDIAGNTLSADAVLGSTSGNFDIDIQRNATSYMKLSASRVDLNRDIVPVGSSTRSLGSQALSFLNIHSEGFQVNDGAGNAIGSLTNQAGVLSIESALNGVNSRDIQIVTADGVATDGNSGSISIVTGAKDGAGVRGDLLLDANIISMNLADKNGTASIGEIKFIHDTSNGDQVGIFANVEGADLVIFTQYSTSVEASGNIDIVTGAGSDAGPTGYAWFSSGDQSGNGSSGEVRVFSGTSLAINTGNVHLYSGDASGGNSGDIYIKTGIAGTSRGTIQMTSEKYFQFFNTANDTFIMVKQDRGASVQTANNSPTTIDTIPLANNSLHIVESYIFAMNSANVNKTGVYKRTLHVRVNGAGVVTIVAVQSDFTSEDVNQLNVSFSTGVGSLVVQAVGINAQTWNWRAETIVRQTLPNS